MNWNPFRRFSEQRQLVMQLQQRVAEIPKLQNQIAALQQRNLAAAAQNRLVEDWLTTRASINDIIQRGMVAVRERARQLAREDGYGKKFVGLCKANISGPDGAQLELNIVDDNGKEDEKAQAKIKLSWEKWCRRKYCSTSQEYSFWDIEQLICTSTPAAGEFLIRKVRAKNGNPFEFSLQFIEPECLDETINKNLEDGNQIRMGVERDVWGRRVAYHIRTQNPYDSYQTTKRGKVKIERVPARDIIHGFVPFEVGQVRGLSWFLPVMVKMHMLDGYDEAAIVAARAAASKMGFLEQMPDAGGNYPGEGEDADGNILNDFSPGSIEKLPPGWKFNGWDPSHPHTEHGNFIKATLRTISAGLWVAYNSLGNDLEGVNYSSIRAGLLDERDMWKIHQNWLRQIFHNEVFEDWLDAAMLTGQVDLPFAKFDKFNRPAFMFRRWPWVDPEKDIKASILAVENGFNTRTDICAEAGGNFKENARVLESEEQEAERRKLKFSGLKGYKEEPQEKPPAQSAE